MDAVTFTLMAGALMTANITSDVGTGPWFEFEGRYTWMSIHLGLRAVLPAKVVVGPADFDMSEYVGVTAVCFHYLWFFGCPVAAGGALVGYDAEHALIGRTVNYQQLVQVGGRVGADVPFGDSRFGLHAWADFMYSSPSDAVFWDHTGYKWVSPNLGIFMGLGLRFLVDSVDQKL